MGLLTNKLVFAGLIAHSLLSQAESIGPAAFVWPEGRAWSSSNDNSPPCGSSEGVTSRTEFPLTNGAVSLLINQETYNINLAISYTNDPSTTADFVDLVPYSNFPDLEAGRECYSVPDPPSAATTGTNATLQLTYISENSNGENDTFYACADITYVKLSSFTEEISCYNSTSGSGTTQSASGVAPTPAASQTSGSGSSSSGSSSGSSHSRMSGGAIAGIVVGLLFATGIAAATVLVIIKRRVRRIENRISSELRVAELKRLSKQSASTNVGSV